MGVYGVKPQTNRRRRGGPFQEAARQFYNGWQDVALTDAGVRCEDRSWRNTWQRERVAVRSLWGRKEIRPGLERFARALSGQQPSYVPQPGEDRRIVRVSNCAGDSYQPLDSPRLLTDLARLYELDDAGVQRFYARWGTLRLPLWYLWRQGEAAREWIPELLSGSDYLFSEPLWLAKRESYRLRVLQSFVQGLSEAVGDRDGRPDDTLLKSLFFPGLAERCLSGRKHDRKTWFAPIVDTKPYGMKYKDLPWFLTSTGWIKRDTVTREQLIMTARVFLRNEVADVLAAVRVCPFETVSVRDVEIMVQHGIPGGLSGVRLSPSHSASPLSPGYEYRSLLDAAYLVLYGQLTGGEYQACPNCGATFLPWEGREGEKRGRPKRFCCAPCEHSYNERQRHARKREPPVSDRYKVNT